MTDMSGRETRGTFECPICGQDTPHHHSDIVVAAWRKRHVHPAPTNPTEYEKGRQAGFEEALRCVDDAALASPSTQEPALRGGKVEELLYFPLDKAQEIALACANELMQVGPQICLFPRSRSEAIIASHVLAALCTHTGESAVQSERAREVSEAEVTAALSVVSREARIAMGKDFMRAAIAAARKAGGE